MVPFLFGQTGYLFTDTGQVSFKFSSVLLIGEKKMAASPNLENDKGKEGLALLGLILPLLLPAGSCLI